MYCYLLMSLVFAKLTTTKKIELPTLMTSIVLADNIACNYNAIGSLLMSLLSIICFSKNIFNAFNIHVSELNNNS